LIGRALSNRWVEVQHILPDGRIEAHDVGEQRLVTMLDLTQAELFDTYSSVVAKAYELQGSRVAFRIPTLDESDAWIGRNP
jgi:hypothetical protein